MKVFFPLLLSLGCHSEYAIESFYSSSVERLGCLDERILTLYVQKITNDVSVDYDNPLTNYDALNLNLSSSTAILVDPSVILNNYDEEYYDEKVIVYARLQFYATEKSKNFLHYQGKDTDVLIAPILDQWNPETVTAETIPENSPYDSAIAKWDIISANAFLSVDVTNYVANDASNYGSVHGFILTKPHSNNVSTFYSSETQTDHNGPELIVGYCHPIER